MKLWIAHFIIYDGNGDYITGAIPFVCNGRAYQAKLVGRAVVSSVQGAIFQRVEQEPTS